MTPHIIGMAQPPEDYVDLPLATKARNPIYNEQRMEQSLAQLQAAVAFWHDKFPDNELRSITATYNCVGMVFGSRRTEILTKHVRGILADDGFKALAHEGEAKRGDLVVYVADGEEVQHVGMVVEVFAEVDPAVQPPFHVRVLSKWGAMGEYIHWVEAVPNTFGKAQYFSERKKLP